MNGEALSRELHQLRRRAAAHRRRCVVTVAAYPVAVVATMATMCLWLTRVVSPAGPPVFPGRLLAADLCFAAAVLGPPAFVGARFVGRAMLLRDWWWYWSTVAIRTAKGTGAVRVLCSTEFPRRRRMPRPASFRGGESITAILVSAGCPEPYLRLLRVATTEPNWHELLVAELRDQDAQARGQRERRAAALQPLSVLGAGAVVLWLTVRVVRPLLLSNLQGGVRW
jgi:hypothetical protein